MASVALLLLRSFAISMGKWKGTILKCGEVVYGNYRYLNDTRYKGDWTPWIQFFLQCVHLQAKQNVRLIQKVNDLYEEDLEKASALVNSQNIRTVVNVMFQHPIFTAKQMAELTGLPEATVRRYLNRFEEQKLIFSDGRMRSKTYYYYNLLDQLR
ncbi:Fic family protein [Geobacillus proteiniphilus]|uniref:Fic family protein n=1 Tax=Geobacillus proteiniphilus TaxID=860353 RepID=UPI003FCEAB20